ncbi:MAG: family 16 glycosylhydrolase [Paludibacteraceae bacterium]|nr:family 16 glycosylhydrolase [Paludibacteraceae bacterium]
MKMLQTLLLSALCLVGVGCNQKSDDSKEPSSTITLSVSPIDLELKVGALSLITAKTNATSITWSSSDENVADVSDGAVMAIGIGEATITAKAGDKTATCSVHVIGANDEMLSISPAKSYMKKGETLQLTYSAAYQDLPLTFTSSADSVATVSSTGLVTALKGGDIIITLTNGLESCTAEVIVEHNWSDYELVWEENFDGNSLDLAVWNIEVNSQGGGNNEKQYYTDRPENLRVQNGNLEIELRKEEYGNRSYTSGRINSKNKKVFKYGKIEARMSLPSGGGTWPAFWMMGNRGYWPQCGEIDIMEHIGNQPSMVSFALHTVMANGSRGNNWSSRIYSDGVENEYHVYGIEWIEEYEEGLDLIYFTYDGEIKATKVETLEHKNDNAYWPFNKDFYFILNLAVGGNMGGNIDDSMFEHDVIMYVDWIKVYQKHEIE